MLFRPRIVDSIAVLGILLLLVFTPAYLAQDPAERDLAKGVSFDLPAPRIGDKATLELVLQWGDEEPVLVPDVRTIEVREVAPGEVPVHARYVIEETRNPLNVTFPWGTLERDTTIKRQYFDGEGHSVWITTTYQDPPAEDVQKGDVGSVARVWSLADDDGMADLNHFPNARVVYHPSDVALIRQDIAANLPTFIANMQGNERYEADWRSELSAEVVRQRGVEHFVVGRDPYETITGAVWPGASFRGTHRFAQDITFHDDANDGMVGYAAGEFANERWFMPIGGWQRFLDAENGTRLDAWAFPSDITHGTGEPLPVKAYRRFTEDRYFRPAAAEPALPTIALEELPRQETEWLRGVTLPELVALLQGDDATAAVRHAAQGRLAGFAWEAGPGDSTPAATDGLPVPDLPVPIPPTQPTADDPPGTTYRDTWIAAFVASDGNVSVVNATIETEALGHTLIASADLCDGFERRIDGLQHVSCHPVPVSLSAPSRLTVEPAAALERARTHDATAGFPDRFAYQPLGRYEELFTSPYETTTWGRWVSPFAYVADVPYPMTRYHPDDAVPTGTVSWHSEHGDGETSGGTLWGNTGHVLLLHAVEHQSDDTGLASGTAPMTASAAGPATPEHLDIRSGDAITGSLFLLGIWAFIRAIFAFKSGAWLPVYAFLYAKIAKKDVLEHERRDAIVSLLESDPGLTTTEIGERLDMGWGTTVHHLETLRRNGLLSMVRHGHRSHYFGKNAMDKQQRLLFVYSRDAIYGPFLRTVTDKPGAPLKEIVGAIRQGKAGASRTGKRLVELGLLRREKNGREVRFYPAT